MKVSQRSVGQVILASALFCFASLVGAQSLQPTAVVRADSGVARNQPLKMVGSWYGAMSSTRLTARRSITANGSSSMMAPASATMSSSTTRTGLRICALPGATWSSPRGVSVIRSAKGPRCASSPLRASKAAAATTCSTDGWKRVSNFRAVRDCGRPSGCWAQIFRTANGLSAVR